MGVGCSGHRRPDLGTAAALFLAAKAPERATSLTIGGGAVRFPTDAGGALKDVIEAPSLDVVRALDASLEFRAQTASLGEPPRSCVATPMRVSCRG
jgi:hypothetical protein